MENLCCTWWALPIFALLSGFLGWILRDWLLRGKKEKYEEEIRRRDAQILNTSTLLNKEISQKEEHINKMVAEINNLQSGNKKLTKELSALQLSIKDRSDEPTRKEEIEVLTATHDLVEADDDSIEVVSSGEEGQEAVDGFEVGEPLEAQVEDAMLDDIITLKRKLKRRRSKIKKLRTEVEKLTTKNKSLQSQLKKASSPIIKEVPVTIKQEVEVREKVDQKKLLKLLSKLPIKKSTKIIDTSTTKGKPRIIKKK